MTVRTADPGKARAGVAAVEKVGLCDSSGCEAPDGGTSNAHLHLEYWKDGVKTCPVDKLGNCATKA